MKHQAVSSSNVRSVGYDEETNTLEIIFNSSGTYQYSGVPIDVYKELLGASSVGQYFQQNIKGQYSFRKVA